MSEFRRRKVYLVLNRLGYPQRIVFYSKREAEEERRDWNMNKCGHYVVRAELKWPVKRSPQ